MDDLRGEMDNLNTVAAACGLDPNDVVEDIASSDEIAHQRFMELVEGRPDEVDEYNEAFLRGYWDTFLQQYSLKCFERWLSRCGDSRDYQTMENLWHEYFDPLWLSGCNVQARITVKRSKDGMESSLKLQSDLRKIQRKDLEKVEAWIANVLKALDEALLAKVAHLREPLGLAVTESIMDLKGHDDASPFEKLKRRLFG